MHTDAFYHQTTLDVAGDASENQQDAQDAKGTLPSADRFNNGIARRLNTLPIYTVLLQCSNRLFRSARVIVKLDKGQRSNNRVIHNAIRNESYLVGVKN